MKTTEKLLRFPLPDQLKAVVEKFDGRFDSSDLRKLSSLANHRGFTRYERYMLNRTLHKASRKLALTEAIEMVLNLKPDSSDHLIYQGRTPLSKSDLVMRSPH